jgi:hypothetical protein
MTFTLQTSDTCAGKVVAIVCVSQGVHDMRVGGKRLLVLPAGFRERTVEVELRAVEDDSLSADAAPQLELPQNRPPNISAKAIGLKAEWENWPKIRWFSREVPYHEDLTGTGKEVTPETNGALILKTVFCFDGATADFKGQLTRDNDVDSPGPHADIYGKLKNEANRTNIILPLDYWPVIGMKEGGKRRVISSGRIGACSPAVYEFNLLRVDAPVRELEDAERWIGLNGGIVKSEFLGSERDRRTATIQAEAAYRRAANTAKTPGKIDMSVFGVLLGFPWNGVQDVRDCATDQWMVDNQVPFCTERTTGHDNERWLTCAKIDQEVFDTSWVISPVQVNADAFDTGVIGSFQHLAALAGKSGACKVRVGVLPNGSVGLVSIATSRLSRDVANIMAQLKGKYGAPHTVRNGSWRDTGGSYTTERLSWRFPYLHVDYAQQVETTTGEAFDGGSLEISTPAWRSAVEKDAEQNRKRPL